MKQFISIIYLFITILSAGEIQKIPLSMKSSSKENVDIEYRRGSFLIIQADSYLSSYLTGSFGGSFIDFKASQGFDVDIMSLEEENLEVAVTKVLTIDAMCGQENIEEENIFLNISLKEHSKLAKFNFKGKIRK